MEDVRFKAIAPHQGADTPTTPATALSTTTTAAASATAADFITADPVDFLTSDNMATVLAPFDPDWRMEILSELADSELLAELRKQGILRTASIGRVVIGSCGCAERIDYPLLTGQWGHDAADDLLRSRSASEKDSDQVELGVLVLPFTLRTGLESARDYVSLQEAFSSLAQDAQAGEVLHLQHPEASNLHTSHSLNRTVQDAHYLRGNVRFALHVCMESEVIQIPYLSAEEPKGITDEATASSSLATLLRPFVGQQVVVVTQLLSIAPSARTSLPNLTEAASAS